MTIEKLETQQRELSAESKALVMAVGILADRVARLPDQDKLDLFELAKALRNAKSQEELLAAQNAMLEILDQSPVTASRMNLPSERPADLQQWVDYIGARIRKLRKAKGLSQDELAKASGLPQSHISRLEAGQHSPSHLTVQKLAKALGAAVNELDPSA